MSSAANWKAMGVSSFCWILGACYGYGVPSADEDATIDARAPQVDTDRRCDSDGDGWLHPDCAGGEAADCDDTVSAVHPGAVENCESELDEDCDGEASFECDETLLGHSIRENTGYLVENGSLTAHFDSGVGYALASIVLQGDSDNLLHTSGSMPEKYVGIGSYPDYYQWRDASPEVSVLAQGAAVFQLRIQSVDSNGDTKNPQSLAVDSLYTLFPDGRIHRHEEVSPVGLTGYLTAYTSLDLDRFEYVAASFSNNSPRPIPQTPPSPVEELLSSMGASESGWMCAYTEDSHLLGTTYSVQSAEGPRIPHSRLSPATDDDEAIALDFDWQRSGAIAQDTYLGDFVIWGGAPDTGQEACGELARLNSWLSTPALVSAGADSSLDGGDSGYFRGEGYWALRSNNGTTVEISTSTSGARSPLARPVFRIAGLTRGNDVQPLVTLNGTGLIHGRDYLWQPADSTQDDSYAWIFLNRSMGDKAQLQIRMPGAD